MSNEAISPRSDPGSDPPISAEKDLVTATMLESRMMDPPPRPGVVGRIGRFEVIRNLGVGGMGAVMLAREPITDAQVAIKTIVPRLAKEKWAVQRFLTEAQHMYRMSHPNILKVMEVSNREEGPYYVMPYIQAGCLDDRLRAGGRMPTEEILSVSRQMASALAHAHGKGIIHRDLKPANVLIDDEGQAYLTDFGLLRTVFNDADVNVQQGSIEGTAPYMSPLAAKGKAEDTRCDIYAFGALLYEMLAGLPPYRGADANDILAKIAAGPPTPIRTLNPNAPEALVRIAEKAMARELRDRYAEMTDVIAELDGLDRGAPPPPASISAAAGAVSLPREAYVMDIHVQIVAALHLAFGLIGCAIALVVLVAVTGGGALSGDLEAMRVTGKVGPAIASVIILFSLPGVIGGVAYFMGKSWARIFLIILSALDLLNLPLGTAMGVYGLWALLRKAPTA